MARQIKAAPLERWYHFTGRGGERAVPAGWDRCVVWIWTEDDATRGHEGHEGVNQATKRIFPYFREEPVATEDYGDGWSTLHRSGVVIETTCEGSRIGLLAVRKPPERQFIV